MATFFVTPLDKVYTSGQVCCEDGRSPTEFRADGDSQFVESPDDTFNATITAPNGGFAEIGFNICCATNIRFDITFGVISDADERLDATLFFDDVSVGSISSVSGNGFIDVPVTAVACGIVAKLHSDSVGVVFTSNSITAVLTLTQ